MHTAPWKDRQPEAFPVLDDDLNVDVAIIGGGITGLTAAYMLQNAGQQVAVLERDRIGSGETSRTTAHLTQITDVRLTELAHDFGDRHAQLVLQGGRVAIDTIEAAVEAHNLNCGFRRLPGYIHASFKARSDERASFQAEVETAHRLGLKAEYIEDISVVHKPGVRYADQACFHPLAYLQGLAKVIASQGGHIFEQTEVTQLDHDSISIQCGPHTVHCQQVLIATHVPLQGRNDMLTALLLQSKLYPYTSYAIEARVAAGTSPDALFWDTTDPYYYLRPSTHDGEDFVIFGGEDHKTGQSTDTSQNFARLAEVLHSFLPQAEITRRWSGQVIETNDGLPYIGRAGERQFIATGYAGNGMTFGTLGGLMAYDAFVGRPNPWRELFDPQRTHLQGGTWDYLQENVDYPYYMAKDWLTPLPTKSIADVAPGEGQVFKLDGKTVACSCSRSGEVKVVSGICTHMGCLVSWNNAEQTWDCGCHGSRFHPDGSVLGGPAEQPLEQIKSSTPAPSQSPAAK